MRDVKTMAVNPAIQGLLHFTHILLGTLLHTVLYITLEDLQVTLILTINYSPVIALENTSVTNRMGQVLHLAVLYGWFSGSLYGVDVNDVQTRGPLRFLSNRMQ